MGIKYLENEQNYKYNFVELFIEPLITDFDFFHNFKNVYYLTYSFVNSDFTLRYEERTKFFNYLRFNIEKDGKIKYLFVQNILSRLNEIIIQNKIDAIVYSDSESGSFLCKILLEMINRIISSNTILTYKLRKNLTCYAIKPNNFDSIKDAKSLLFLDVLLEGFEIFDNIEAIRTKNPDCKILLFNNILSKEEINFYVQSRQNIT